ncbi:MAG: hypothetical protein ACI9W6_002612 [Motiliproteus sp.]|jgi:hypothetical protein
MTLPLTSPLTLTEQRSLQWEQSAQERAYLILDADQGYLQALYARQPDVRAQQLLKGTQYEAIADIGPWILDVTDSVALIEQLEAERVQGIVRRQILITASLSKEQLIAFCQNRLFIGFGQQRLGFFRYYDPRVIHELLRVQAAQQTTSWCAALTRILWFHEPPWSHDTGDGRWMCLHNPLQVPDRQWETYRLTPAEEEALGKQQSEQFLAQQLESRELGSTQARLAWWQFYQPCLLAAEQRGITSDAGLGHYLRLCEACQGDAIATYHAQTGLGLPPREAQKLTVLSAWYVRLDQACDAALGSDPESPSQRGC